MRVKIWVSIFVALFIILSFSMNIEDYQSPGREDVKDRAIKKIYKGRLAIIIDDIGFNNKKEVKEIIDMDVPITLSILPFQPFSLKVAKEAHAGNKEIILHLPMEPYDYPKKNPGNGILTIDMDEKELIEQTEKNLSAIPYIIGVNNHMGSKFTENYERMKIVINILKHRGLFFIDSLTSKKSVGYKIARELGLPVERRDIFLDNNRNIEAIKNELEKLCNISLKKGKAIGIGHPYPNTVKALKEMIPKFREKGIKIVKLSSIVKN
jgi:hypothetical protein